MSPFGREPERPADPSPEWNEHWAAVLGLPDPDPCRVCRKDSKAADCQQWERVWAVLRRWFPDRVPPRRPARVVVCKDCCIGLLGGHQCPWWDLCWPV